MKKHLLFLPLLFTGFTVWSQAHNFEWASALSGVANEQGSSVCTDAAGNVYTVGCFQNTVDFDPGPLTYNLTSNGDYDIFISKLDANGNFLWAKSMGSADTEYGYGIDIDGQNNIYITGMFNGTVDFDPQGGVTSLTSFGDGDIFICKYTSMGNLVYAKQFGGPYIDVGHQVVVDHDGNAYATGDFDFVADFDPSASTYNLYGQSCTNLYVVKLGLDGNMIWAVNTSGPSQGFDIDLDETRGMLAVTGPYYYTMDFDPGPAAANISSLGEADIFVWKLDVNGNHVWVKSFGSANTGGGFDCGNAVAFDSEGNVYSTGFYIGTTDFDPNAGVMNLTSGNYDAFISKLDAGGNYVWAKKIGGYSAQRGFDIAVDEQQNVYITGDFIDVTNFDPGVSNVTIQSTWSANSMFVQKFDASGNFLWVEQIGGNGIGYCVKLDVLQNIYVSGVYYYQTADFDFTSNIYNLTAVGEYDALVYKISQGTVGLDENANAPAINVYPNPAADKVFMNAPDAILSIRIMDHLGRLISCSANMDGDNAWADLQNESGGVYFIQIQTTKGTFIQRVVKS